MTRARAIGQDAVCTEPRVPGYPPAHSAMTLVRTCRRANVGFRSGKVRRREPSRWTARDDAWRRAPEADGSADTPLQALREALLG